MESRSICVEFFHTRQNQINDKRVRTIGSRPVNLAFETPSKTGEFFGVFDHKAVASVLKQNGVNKTFSSTVTRSLTTVLVGIDYLSSHPRELNRNSKETEKKLWSDFFTGNTATEIKATSENETTPFEMSKPMKLLCGHDLYLLRAESEHDGRQSLNAKEENGSE